MGSFRQRTVFLFEHPINIDTIEAIIRSETYIRKSPSSAPPEQVMLALLEAEKKEDVLDDFWLLKDKIYSLLIQGPVGILADHIAVQYVEEHLSNFSRDDYYKTERQLRRSSPGIFGALETARTSGFFAGKKPSGTASLIRFNTRQFFLDKTKPSGEPGRYCQTKVVRWIDLDKPLKSHRLRRQIENDMLFDDSSTKALWIGCEVSYVFLRKLISFHEK